MSNKTVRCNYCHTQINGKEQYGPNLVFSQRRYVNNLFCHEFLNIVKILIIDVFEHKSVVNNVSSDQIFNNQIFVFISI